MVGTVISRRRVLSAGLGVGAAMLCGVGAGGCERFASAWLTSRARGREQSGSDAVWSPHRSSIRKSGGPAGGQLSTTLRVRYAYQDIGGYRLHLRSYEGMTPGPTLRARPGDVLRIRLVNELPPNRDPQPSDHNLPNRFNTTNLHMHGMHVSPDGIADNVLREMEPGQAYEIEVPIPASHPPGTYWYHPHRHGSANVQVASGMAGAMILEGDFADVPQIASARERVLILQQLAFDALGTCESFDTVWPMQAAPPVHRQRTAAAHDHDAARRGPALAHHPRRLPRLHALGLDGHLLHEIAADGIALPGVRTQESILVVPGQRTDVLVQAGAPGTYALRSLPFDQGEGANRTWVLADVVVAGEPMPMDLPTTLPPGPLAPIRAEELTGTTRDHLLRRKRPPQAATISASSASWSMAACSITTASTSASASARSRNGTIVNLDEADHPFHIHTNPFLVTQDQRRGTGRADLAGHRERARPRQRDDALALRGFHGPLRAALPHPEPRGASA